MTIAIEIIVLKILYGTITFWFLAIIPSSAFALIALIALIDNLRIILTAYYQSLRFF